MALAWSWSFRKIHLETMVKIDVFVPGSPRDNGSISLVSSRSRAIPWTRHSDKDHKDRSQVTIATDIRPPIGTSLGAWQFLSAVVAVGQFEAFDVREDTTPGLDIVGRLSFVPVDVAAVGDRGDGAVRQ